MRRYPLVLFYINQTRKKDKRFEKNLLQRTISLTNVVVEYFTLKIICGITRSVRTALPKLYTQLKITCKVLA